MNDVELRDEINKRFTLNWLIQSASEHAGMTLHHLVRDELDVLDPGLVRLYDQFALINLLQYWHFESALLLVLPPGNYSAVVFGNGGTGIALLEVTDMRNGGLRATASTPEQSLALIRERAARPSASAAPELCVSAPLSIATLAR